jgi:hypothetical protein
MPFMARRTTMTLREARETIARLRDEVLDLRSESFDLAAQLEVQRNLVAALEEVVKATAKLRDKT